MALNSTLSPDKGRRVPERPFAEADLSAMNGLSLAFIGDAVYELAVRQYITGRADAKIGELHSESVKLVNADFQAQAAERILAELKEDELSIFKRGRNAHPSHIPRNKTGAQYHKATGLEAVVGYLYLKKDFERIKYLFSVILRQGEEKWVKE